MDKELSHIGTKHHSGRYPWGSGDDPEQRGTSLRAQYLDLKKKGMSESDIAKGFKLSIKELRSLKSLEKDDEKITNAIEARKLRDKGMSNVAIGERMGRNESYVRTLLKDSNVERAKATQATATVLKDGVNKHDYIDVGVGIERYLGVSRTKLMTAIKSLEDEGYTVHKFSVEQVGTGKKTTMMVLAKPETTWGDAFKNRYNVKMLMDQKSDDGGKTFQDTKPKPIQSIESSRVKIRYGDEGGVNKDGMIELRRGVEDLSLGNSKYAQVRIGVDGTHYLKGMAMYSTDVPKGYDIIYNTNKKTGTPPERVFKEMNKNQDGSIDLNNPFGATIKQGGQRKALNIVNEEGDWQDKWSKNLSSQMLSKQSPNLAQKQLGLTYLSKKEEFDEIMSLTNPVVKKRLLDSFADDCDSSAVHLKAAALPREGWHAILPFPNMKENEVYAPNFRQGENVVLIRYPHGGKFEIPELKVNNSYADAKNSLGQARDAIGIHPKVAERLSGADFDGDTVLVIPNSKGLIKTEPALKGLKDFDTKAAYPPYHGMKTIDGGVWDDDIKKVDYGGKSPSSRGKGLKMGDVSNLITDMTIKGANADEICRAVKHSMVVIDAEKHHLDYKRSYDENGIGALKKRYQGRSNAGASTLISRASSEARIKYREEGKKGDINPKTGKPRRIYIDPNTGKKLYEYTGETYTQKRVLKDGTIKEKVLPRMTKSTKMFEAEDAFDLSSGTPMENVYASHANKLKALGNEARKASLSNEYIPYSPSAKKVYAQEVNKLTADLNIALKNAPLERHAQLIANSIIASKKAANPNMDADDLKKLKGQELAKARARTGANKHSIEISDRQWEAIQSGAVSKNTLTQILANTNIDKIKQLATPKTRVELSNVKVDKAKLMLATGYTQAEIADHLGVSVSTISKLLK